MKKSPHVLLLLLLLITCTACVAPDSTAGWRRTASPEPECCSASGGQRPHCSVTHAGASGERPVLFRVRQRPVSSGCSRGPPAPVSLQVLKAPGGWSSLVLSGRRSVLWTQAATSHAGGESCLNISSPPPTGTPSTPGCASPRSWRSRYPLTGLNPYRLSSRWCIGGICDRGDVLRLSGLVSSSHRPVSRLFNGRSSLLP